MSVATEVDLTTPGGHPAHFLCRIDTSDETIVRSVVGDDEYGLAGLQLDGYALDVGAHIGGVAISLALDHPELTVIAVEALPANLAVLLPNINLNGLYGRVIPLAGAAARERVGAIRVAYGFDGLHRYIGNLQQDGATETRWVRAASLTEILDNRGIQEAALLKIDCEGCEWDFLTDPAVSRVRLIVGEVHPGASDDPFVAISGLLASTHEVTVFPEQWLFRAVRR